MPKQVIGSIPEFTTDDSVGEVQDINAPQATPESGVETSEETSPEVEEKETPSDPSTEEEPASAETTQPEEDDTRDDPKQDTQADLQRAIDGLKATRMELLEEVKELRGQKREAKQAEAEKVQEDIDQLEDVNPDDLSLIDRILKARGYVSKKDLDTMLLESKKSETYEKFFQEHPEYSEEKDPDRSRFNQLLSEVSLYKEPRTPQQLATFLQKAHRAINPMQVSSERNIAIKKRQVQVAGVGSGGTQRSPSQKSSTLSDERKRQLLDGGWSAEEIKQMEERANQE